ncbi:MAG: transcriptional repressor NrdR [Clostridia bacterium]|nr:transcriptional repressor NrdR [Clostridia bacterium]MBR5767204.1 transcriptional repressor NrdR [Clostridia bacterium]
MKCPQCGYPDSKVVDSRPTENEAIRRRRMCLKCGSRFTTYESYLIPTVVPVMVIKKNGSAQLFDRNKILTGLLQACYKRPVERSTMLGVIDAIEDEIRTSGKTSVTSSEIGKMVMDRLKRIDDVSYVRFASVYREFKDVETFRREIDSLSADKDEPGADK